MAVRLIKTLFGFPDKDIEENGDDEMKTLRSKIKETHRLQRQATDKLESILKTLPNYNNGRLDGPSNPR